ncbi:MAG: hypothetical protein HXY29_09585 [Rhodocyclaceae bacterium]|jgi:hypothetical protein|nr:hypothetical protein [Rhodocyclaceae bacterium]
MTERRSLFRCGSMCGSAFVTLALIGCAQNPTPVNGTGAVGNASEAVAKAGSKVIGGPLIPDAVVQISPTVSYPLEKLVYWGLYIGAAWLIVDPLAPNWEIEEARLPDDYVHFSLKMKRIYSGGAGEARAVLERRAKTLVREGGFKGYEIVEYAERLDSSVLGSQRKAEGVIRLIKKPA